MTLLDMLSTADEGILSTADEGVDEVFYLIVLLIRVWMTLLDILSTADCG